MIKFSCCSHRAKSLKKSSTGHCDWSDTSASQFTPQQPPILFSSTASNGLQIIILGGCHNLDFCVYIKPLFGIFLCPTVQRFCFLMPWRWSYLQLTRCTYKDICRNYDSSGSWKLYSKRDDWAFARKSRELRYPTYTWASLSEALVLNYTMCDYHYCLKCLSTTEH